MDQSIPILTEDLEHPCVEMDAVLKAPQVSLEIVEHEFNEAEYFLVLDCEPEIENNEHQYGVPIRKTTRSYTTSRTDIGLIKNNTAQPDDSGLLVSDGEDTNGTKELPACNRPVVMFTKLKAPDVSQEFNFNNKRSTLQHSSDAANLKHPLRNNSSKQKSVQSTSSSIFLGETGSRNLKNVIISDSSLGVPRFEAEDNEHQDFATISKTTRTFVANTTDIELININATLTDDSASLVSDRADTNRTKDLSACTRPAIVSTKLKISDVSDGFNSKNKTSLAQPSSDAANRKHLLKNETSKKKRVQSTSSSIFLGKTGSSNLKNAIISDSSLEVPRVEAEDNEHQDVAAINKTARTFLADTTDMELLNSNTTQTDDSGSLVSDRADTNRTKELSACTRSAVVLKKLKKSDVSDELNSKNTTSLPQPSSDVVNRKHRLRNKSSKKKSGQSPSSRIFLLKIGSGNSKKLSVADSSLKVGERVGNGRASHKCNFCEKVSTSSGRLENHIRVHTREKPFKCSFCGKSFSGLGSLKIHKTIHTGERSFQCSFCAKTFVQPSHLKNHERIHTGERPFKCRFCTKAFAQSSHLKDHERFHSGERPFECTFCAKAFSRLYSLKRHKRTHNGERPFECSFCKKAFNQSSHLRRHERTHNGEKPFK